MKIVAKGLSRRRLATPSRGSRRGGGKRTITRAELKRQCALANAADKRDNWRQFVFLPE